MKRIILTPFQVQMIQTLLGKEGLGKGAIKTFMEQLQPVVSQVETMQKVCSDMARQMEPVMKDRIPPKNGPKYNPHARHGKGGRRR